MEEFIGSRKTPDRDSKYMGLAWIHAAFSKDPSTQVGSVVINKDNIPLGSGYNGLSSIIDDDTFNWRRPPEDEPDVFSKYDMVIHAEINAIDHSCDGKLDGSTLYVICLPCPACMLTIANKGIKRVVYTEFKSHSNSMLQNSKAKKAFEIAELHGVSVEKFSGDISWIKDWISVMNKLGAFENQY